MNEYRGTHFKTICRYSFQFQVCRHVEIDGPVQYQEACFVPVFVSKPNHMSLADRLTLCVVTTDIAINPSSDDKMEKDSKLATAWVLSYLWSAQSRSRLHQTSRGDDSHQ